ncbi:MAG: alpha/beta hydrolase, partial [Pseudomonadota bacterium]
EGHGQSSGEFKNGTIGTWLGNALHIIDTLTTGPLLLISSSMGGWIGLHVAQLRPDRVMGFIGIAAAPDFTNWVWNNEMTIDQQLLCTQQGYITTPDGDIFTHKLFLDGAQHSIFDKPLKLNCPVTLLHGKQDDVVPYAVAQQLAKHLTNPQPPKLILIDDGDHRLARPSDLEILFHEIEHILK